jgi:hypothetical protein
MTRTSICGLSGALAGACVALWLTVVSTFLPWEYFRENQRLFTIVAPPTVFLKIFLGIGVSPGLRLFVLIVVIAQNAILYGIVGWIIGKIWNMIQSEPQPE